MEDVGKRVRHGSSRPVRYSEGWIGLKPSSQQYIYHPPPPRLWAAPSAQGPPFPGGSPLVHGRCGLSRLRMVYRQAVSVLLVALWASILILGIQATAALVNWYHSSIVERQYERIGLRLEDRQDGVDDAEPTSASESDERQDPQTEAVDVSEALLHVRTIMTAMSRAERKRTSGAEQNRTTERHVVKHQGPGGVRARFRQ